MSDPTARNRLDEEASPYLRQHADNPVDWQPWDDAALEAARERDVPIFLSVGYSACHWCHVMAEESFEDEDVAAVLNRDFVPVKVDREERPDLDSIYQTVSQLVSGRGGWPLSVWLTPDGKPFYVGTYFPREPRRNMPGFLDLLENIANSWSNPEDRREMENRAEQWTHAAKDQLEDVPSAGADAPDETLLTDAADAVLRAADREYGGFGTGQKFPQEARLHLLLRAYDETGRDAYRDVATQTLDAMANGGLYDHLGGGFHRYCTDRDWTVPHFEKMLYDNAELPRVFLAGYQLTGDERYRTVTEETLEFVERELTHDDGGFFSTLDARSPDDDGESVEGAFYVWTPEEVRNVLDEGDADLFCARYGVTESGNFEHGQTVLTIEREVSDLVDEFDVDASTVEKRLDDARERLFEARADRPRPRRDEKVLAGWNGLMASAFAEAAIVLDPAFADAAADALEFVRQQLWDADSETLSRRFKDGDVKGDAFLEDYAFLARGAFDTYQATGEPDHLGFALDLARAVVRDFWDADEGTVFFTPRDGEELVARPQELRDQSTPSSLGVALDVLLSLDGFAPDEKFADVVETTLATHGTRVETSPLEYPSLALVADRWSAGDAELTVSADDLPVPEAWRETLSGTYLPRRLLAPRPPTADELADWLDSLGLEEAPPVWADRAARDGEPTVYACRGFACSQPTHDMQDALDWFED
ncbi:thioredoxin domain-containing protein [Haloarchaeobius litoreus]|uniref:Thioredoxin domain-containing protein n=1 Tax=Haloarchaeobius litoreus TaxID=755306 RepID=A0ABD6DJN2_9EURY|nr:thioredoxin domain-containing protein [Haloarchaeobius litoreus]